MTASATVAAGPAGPGGDVDKNVLAVLANRRFLVLWLAQLATQVGGNMVLYGLTVQVFTLTQRSTSVSLLILSFLVPAVIFSAVAGVYVDRIDRRLILVITNIARAVAFVALVFVDTNLGLIYLLTIAVSTLTTFFGPAEAAMIPIVVDRRQLLAANSIHIFTLQASFFVGFALMGPLVVNLAGQTILLWLVAALYAVAGALCWTLPAHRPRQAHADPAEALDAAERAVATTFRQLRDGLAYIAANRAVFWPLTYLAITASLIGVLGVLGPGFATQTLGLTERDFVVVVMPLGAGLVMGILVLNVYGRYFTRRRGIEGGLIGLAVTLGVLSVAQRATRAVDLGPLVSLLAVVVVVAFFIGIAYAFVAVPAQTQLQEELPAEVRGRVFGVLNMLVSIASFLPIIIVGPIADAVGTTLVIQGSALLVGLAAVGSIMRGGSSAEPAPARGPSGLVEPVDPVAMSTRSLTAPVPLHRPDDDTGGASPIRYIGGAPGDGVRAAREKAEPGREGSHRP